MKTNGTFMLTGIGSVRQNGASVSIEVESRYRDGLIGLGEFSHVMILWLFDQAPWDQVTLVTPRCYAHLDHDLGVFATRGPFRPNQVAVSVSRILSLEVPKGILRIDWIDAEPESPVIDLKPYHPSCDIVTGFKMPEWCAHWPTNREASGEFDWESEFLF